MTGKSGTNDKYTTYTLLLRQYVHMSTLNPHVHSDAVYHVSLNFFRHIGIKSSTSLSNSLLKIFTIGSRLFGQPVDIHTSYKPGLSLEDAFIIHYVVNLSDLKSCMFNRICHIAFLVTNVSMFKYFTPSDISSSHGGEYDQSCLHNHFTRQYNPEDNSEYFTPTLQNDTFIVADINCLLKRKLSFQRIYNKS
jgi:hypothetical protein